MVFVNEVKYACQSCIKGHRSSSCHHTDRPLFEIKKKGRPIIQCEECRELRKSRKLHVKCCCEGRRVPDEEGTTSQSVRPANGPGKKKTVRKIPTIPTLPNGLRDVVSRGPLGPAHTKSKITSLLNPCQCRDKGICKCTSAGSSSAAHPSLAGPVRTDITDQRKQRNEKQSLGRYLTPMHPCCANRRNWAIGNHGDLVKTAALFTPPPTTSSSKEPVLPLRTSTKFVPLPVFISPPTTVAPTANTSTEAEQEPMDWTCQCGAGCLCLGCKRHQGENASDEPEVLCNETCPTCVNNELGPEMPAILVGASVRHRRAHSYSASGTCPGVASFAPYEDHAGPEFGDLGWEDAEGSPDPDFIELPPGGEERCSVDVKVEKETDKENDGLGLQIEQPKLAQAQQTAPATKNASIVAANVRQHVRGCCARRL